MTYEQLDQAAYRFPAVLKNAEGQVQEVATATFYPESRSLEFENDFVPLFSMKTQLQVFRLQDDVEVQRFIGEVYLSSHTMLRLVSVRDQLLPESVLVCSYPVDLEASITAIIREKQKRGLFRRMKEVKTVFTANVQEISMHGVKFATELVLEQGQLLNISIVQPQVLTDIALQVDLAMVFGQKLNSYRCHYINLDGQAQSLLQPYLGWLSERFEPIFPNEPASSLYGVPHSIESV